jgi:hypothetical protein
MGLESEYGNIVQDIDNVLKFMFENDLSEKIILFKKTTSKLDALRNENFSATFPELTDLVHPPGGP